MLTKAEVLERLEQELDIAGLNLNIKDRFYSEKEYLELKESLTRYYEEYGE